MLIEENIDIGIMAANSLSPFEEQSTVLRDEEVYFAIPVNHPYRSHNQNSPIPVRELTTTFSQENFLLSKKGSTLRTLADHIFNQYHYKPSAMCETNSITATRSMVAKGVGVTFIADSCADDTDHVAYYPLEPKQYRYNLLVLRKNWILNTAEEDFCTCIRNCFPEDRQELESRRG